EVESGKAAPDDLSLTWVRQDLLKAQGNKQYIPFTIAVDPSKASGDVTVYWRVVSKDAAAAAPAADEQADRDRDRGRRDRDRRDRKEKQPEYAYEDLTTAQVPKNGRISRSFTVEAGKYDVFVV